MLPLEVGTEPEHSRTGSIVDSDLATSFDNLGWPPEIVVNLEEDIRDPGAWPTTCDRESDTDTPVPPALAVVAASVAAEEISTLLQEFPLTQPLHRSTPEPGTTPELLGPIDTKVELGLPAPLCFQPPP